MPPPLALFLTVVFIAILFARDLRQKANVTGALWLPFLWVTVCGGGSRYFSQWLDMFGLHLGAVSVEDGSPMDAAFNAALILGGLIVLRKRRASVLEFARKNQWLTIYLAYCLLAVIWSDFPFVSTKRWLKLAGDPVMALVILTEPEPMEALIRLMKRCAYILLPVSVLFIKYYPDLGRSFDEWTGVALNSGIATNKNALGFDCWIVGLALVWNFLQVLRWERGKARREELLICAGLMGMNLWLLKMAHSASSLVAFLLGTAILLLLGFRGVQKKHVGAYILFGAAGAALLLFGFGMSETFIHLLGRNDTLTGRTDIWRALWNWNINPVIGTGFEGFWLGDRRLDVQQSVLPFLNEAHNGYLETYLNLGFIGVGITAAMLLATYAKARRQLLRHFEFGRFRLAYLIAFIVYNWTEAAFRMNSFPFFMFFVVAIDYPVRQTQAVEVEASREIFEGETVFAGQRPQLLWP
ncbi:MAG TPA: O-antigen ligase family protein [Candidatus Acidoferrales bacterium]|nr:O-antigen ligase family protein [Candidatus Acidoferrales bacterium]